MNMKLSIEEKLVYRLQNLIHDTKIPDDLSRVSFVLDNIETSGWNGVGFQSIDDFHNYGATANGDCEAPIYFIFYADMPLKGMVLI